jgi:hypothetical protein
VYLRKMERKKESHICISRVGIRIRIPQPTAYSPQRTAHRGGSYSCLPPLSDTYKSIAVDPHDAALVSLFTAQVHVVFLPSMFTNRVPATQEHRRKNGGWICPYSFKRDNKRKERNNPWSVITFDNHAAYL